VTSALSSCGLNGDRQQNLVDLLTELAITDPRWAATNTYRVLPWARIHPGDLSDEELTWHDITSDIDLSTSAVIRIPLYGVLPSPGPACADRGYA
jgi:hypothetical protein